MTGRIIITNRDHPWFSHAGEIGDEQQTGAGKAWTVALDDGVECMVFPGDWRPLRG